MFKKRGLRLIAQAAAIAVFSALGRVFSKGSAAERNTYTMSLSDS